MTKQNSTIGPKPYFEQVAPKKFTTNKPSRAIPGMAMSLKAMVHRMNSGLPAIGSNRVLESYYRGLDLTDMDNLADHAKELRDKLERKQTELRNAKIAESKRAKDSIAELQTYLETLKSNHEKQQ